MNTQEVLSNFKELESLVNIFQKENGLDVYLSKINFYKNVRILLQEIATKLNKSLNKYFMIMSETSNYISKTENEVMFCYSFQDKDIQSLSETDLLESFKRIGEGYVSYQTSF